MLQHKYLSLIKSETDTTHTCIHTHTHTFIHTLSW